MRFLLPLLLLFGGCAFTSESPIAGRGETQHMVEGVPFRAQEGRYDCGAAALSSLLAHRGVDVSVSQIDRFVRDPLLGGTLMAALENHARSLGFSTRSGRGDLDLLRRRIDEGVPVAIPVKGGLPIFSPAHYLVVYGYSERDFLVHDGRRAGAVIEALSLSRGWEGMNRLYLFLE